MYTNVYTVNIIPQYIINTILHSIWLFTSVCTIHQPWAPIHFCRSETRLSRSWQCRCRSLYPTSMSRLPADGPPWSTTQRWSSLSFMTQSYGEQVPTCDIPQLLWTVFILFLMLIVCIWLSAGIQTDSVLSARLQIIRIFIRDDGRLVIEFKTHAKFRGASFFFIWCVLSDCIGNLLLSSAVLYSEAFLSMQGHYKFCWLIKLMFSNVYL